jgi:hypothetical protein
MPPPPTPHPDPIRTLFDSQASSLERFTDRRMGMVVRRALGVCTALFAVVAVGGYLMFGEGTGEGFHMRLCVLLFWHGCEWYAT